MRGRQDLKTLLQSSHFASLPDQAPVWRLLHDIGGGLSPDRFLGHLSRRINCYVLIGG